MTLKTLLKIIDPDEIVEIIYDGISVYQNIIPYKKIEKKYLNRKVEFIETETDEFSKFAILKIHLERKEQWD